MIDDLLRPFELEFFRNGVLVAAIAGGLLGALGVYVVLKGMSYIGHGLSHAIFGGYAASTLTGVSVLLGAGAWGIATGLLIDRISRRRVLGSDAAIGVITSASFALGLVLFALFGRAGRDFDAALFGSVLGVSTGDVWAVVVVAIAAAVLILARYRELLFATFDPEVADGSGIPVARVDALLTVVLAAAILVSMNVLGVTLVAAAIVIPASTARLLTSSFARMLGLATALGVACAVIGMNLSYHLDVQSGPAIVLTATAAFALAGVARSARAAWT